MLSVLPCSTFLSFLLPHADCWLFPQPAEGPCPRASSPRWTFLDFRVSCFSSTCTPCPFVLLGMRLWWSIICTAIFLFGQNNPARLFCFYHQFKQNKREIGAMRLFCVKELLKRNKSVLLSPITQALLLIWLPFVFPLLLARSLVALG